MASKFTTQGLNFPVQGSAEFNGTSDYIQLNDPFSHTNHTVAAWVYANDTAGNKVIFDNRDADNDGIFLRQTASEQFTYSLNDIDLSSTDSFLNEWVFVSVSYDGSNAKLYVNGSLDQSTATSKTINNTTNAVIGARAPYSKSLYWDGNLANVAIWNRALSSDEINSVMFKSVNALTSAESNGLQAWYSLDDIDGTNVPDSSGNGNNGTAN